MPLILQGYWTQENTSVCQNELPPALLVEHPDDSVQNQQLDSQVLNAGNTSGSQIRNPARPDADTQPVLEPSPNGNAESMIERESRKGRHGGIPLSLTPDPPS